MTVDDTLVSTAFAVDGLIFTFELDDDDDDDACKYRQQNKQS